MPQNKNAPAMIRSELIRNLAEKNPHLTQADTDLIVRILLEAIVESLIRGERIEIRDFGAFSVNLRPARMGRNPKTGGKVPVPEKRVIHFKAGKELKERVDK